MFNFVDVEIFLQFTRTIFQNQVAPYTVPPTPYTLATSTHNHPIPQKGVGESKQSITRISTTDPYEEIDMDMDLEAESEDENVQFIPACNTEPSGGKVGR